MNIKDIGPDRIEELETVIRDIKSKMTWIGNGRMDRMDQIDALVRYSIELDRAKRNLKK